MRDRNPQKHGLEESHTFIAFPSCYVNRGGLCITNVLQTRKNNKMSVVCFQFRQLCQILGMLVENVISTQKDLAAICKCSLILKERLSRLIALSRLFLLCAAESWHSRERQRCEGAGQAVLVETPAFGSDDAAESLVPPWTLSGLIVALQGTH